MCADGPLMIREMFDCTWFGVTLGANQHV